MWPVFPASDYYGPSAPPHSHQSTMDLARHPPRLDGGKATMGRFPRSPAIRSAGSAPGYAPAASPRVRRRPSSWPPHRLRFPASESPPRSHGRVCTAARPRSARFEPVPELEGFPPPVHSRCTLSASLAGPGPSGSAGPSRRCQGRFPPDRRTSTGPAALSFKPGCCDSPAVGPSTPPESLAPRGARRSRGTDPVWRCRFRQ